MIYLLWAAIILQGCVTVWLARKLFRWAGGFCEILDSQEELNDLRSKYDARVAAKLRALGQPLD